MMANGNISLNLFPLIQYLYRKSTKKKCKIYATIFTIIYGKGLKYGRKEIHIGGAEL
ncbi:hypothetical protein D3C83_220910 [compost metagenome]